MDNEIAWVDEGSALTDAGHLIITTYVDLRKPDDRLPITSLVRGCERRYALEHCETVLISKPARFQQHGEELVLDPQEGLAKEESVTQTQETPAEISREKAAADLEEAVELLYPQTGILHKETRTNTNTDTNIQTITYAKEWWIFCTAIKPDDDLEKWRNTLPPKYDHISEIGQPAAFAQALARMVADQIGPRGEGSIRNTTEGAETEPSKYKTQWVFHGPVVYVDNVYETLAGLTDNRARMTASIFTKSKKYEAQREYRFAVLNWGAEEETVTIQISGMMKDALKQTQHGLVRSAPVPLNPAATDKGGSSQEEAKPPTPTHWQSTSRHRSTERKEWRWETKGPDGQMLSSNREVSESAQEQTVTQRLDPAQGNYRDDEHRYENDGQTAPSSTVPPNWNGTETLQTAECDEEAVKELARQEFEWEDDTGEQEEFSLPVHTATGRVYKSFEEMLNDPTYPMSPITEPWLEEACTAEEMIKTYRVVAALNMKMHDVGEEFRQDIASAGWYAMLCIRNIYSQIGDIVSKVWIERERFIVIQLKSSEGLDATGRIAIAPSGAYAYTLQLPTTTTLTYGGLEWGTTFFPLGRAIESFEQHGWPKKII